MPTFSNIVFLLALRMIIMVVLLAGISPWLYPNMLGDLRILATRPQLLVGVTASGICLFLGLILLYTALSQVAAGIAIATFFIHPAITLLLAWYFFRQSPHPYQLWLMGIIFIGVVLTTLVSAPGPSSNPVLGGLTGLGAGLFFGLYGLVAEFSLKDSPTRSGMHPIPFSLTTFVIIAILASLTLLGPQAITIAPNVWPIVLAMSLLAAMLTLIAYVLNNSGIRYIGASLTALLSSTTPVLTTIFAWWLMQESLQPQQMVGIGLVTIGVGTLSVKSR